MPKKSSWHAPMSTSQRKRRNRNIAIAVGILVVIAVIAAFLIPRSSGSEGEEDQQVQEPDSSAVPALLDRLDAEPYLELEGVVDLAHIGPHTSVGGYRKSDGSVVGTVRGGGASVSFVDTGAEVFLRTDESGWYLLGVEGTEEMWARSERGLVMDPQILMPLTAVREATSGDFRSTSDTRREYDNGTALTAEGDKLTFDNGRGRTFSFMPPMQRTAEGVENYVSAATKSQAEVLRDGERTWLRLPDGYVPSTTTSSAPSGG